MSQVHAYCSIIFLFSYMYSYDMYSDNIVLPYSGLFSLGANFPKFHKWTHYSRKLFLFLGCCMKFNCGLLLQKLA